MLDIGKREFLRRGAAAFAGSALGGCVRFACGMWRRPSFTRGVVVSAKDLSGDFDWPRLAYEAGLTTIGTHVGPEDVMPFMQSKAGGRFYEGCAKYGIAIEHELHAMDYLLPRSMFDREPELFRMNADGVRVRDANCCAPNPRTLEIVARRAVEVAKVCTTTTGRYHFWLSDSDRMCMCPECRELSGAEQALLVENAILAALRREVEPFAMLSHLAYTVTLDVPKAVLPDPGIFLEFAPFRRWGGVRKREPLVEGGKWLARLDALLKVFPAAEAQVLEYWLDESLFCGWKRPLVRIPWNAEKTRADIAAYARRGIRHFTTFAVSVGDGYVKEFGADSLGCVKEYGELLAQGQ